MKIRWLHNTDYDPIIQKQYLQNQLIQNNPSTLLKAENMAIEDAKSLLMQRYDMEEVFTNTGAWSFTTTYTAADRVIMDYATWSAVSSYNLGDCVIYNKEAYCLTGTTSVAATASFDPSNWSDLGPQYNIYYGAYPQPLFNYQADYVAGDLVYWKGHTYSAVIDTAKYSTTDLAQYQTINNIPLKNVFPDDRVNNKNNTYWMSGATYSIPAGTLPTDETYWVNGDNRSSLLMVTIMDIVIYYLMKNLAPMNIEEHRLHAYKSALKYFTDLAQGKKNTTILKIQPTAAGLNWLSGGNISQGFTW